MKDILFVATYFNNSHFIEYQKICFDNIENTYDFIILNDANPPNHKKPTKSLLSDTLAYHDIENECKKYNIRHIPLPKNVHTHESDGGYIPDGLPLSHPTERHRSSINYFNQNYTKLVKKEYKAYVIVDADLFLKNKINLLDIMGENDMTGAKVASCIIQQKIDDKTSYWPKEYKHIKEPIKITWPWPIFIMINLKHKDKIKDLNIGGLSGTDSGGMIHFFIEKYKLKLGSISCECGPGTKYIGSEQSDIGIYDNKEIFVHYRGGSNWDYNSKDFYFEKFYRLFETFFPEIHKNIEYINNHCKLENIIQTGGEYSFKNGKGF